MLQRIYSASEHWWTCCKQKSPTMQKLPSPYAGCKKQAFREGSCILFCASQTAFGEHLFIWRLEGFVQCSFFSIFGCCSNEAFLLHGQVSEHTGGKRTWTFLHRAFVGKTRDWKPKIPPRLEKETEKAGKVSNPLWACTGFQNHLGGGSITANTSLLSCRRLVHRLPRTESLRWPQRLRRGQVLPPPGREDSVPWTAPRDLKWHMSSGASTATGGQTPWPIHKAPLVWIM